MTAASRPSVPGDSLGWADSQLDAPFDVVCQGCGTVRNGAWLGKGHACWINEDGSREEGGTFQ